MSISVTFSLPNIGWFALQCVGFEAADFEKKRVGVLTHRILIDNLVHGDVNQSTREVNESRVSRIAQDFIQEPFAGKDCPIVCVHPDDADTFDQYHLEKSRYIVMGNNHLVAGLKKAREHHTQAEEEKWNHLSSVECKVYKDLSDSQMKAFGATHNLNQGLHDKMNVKELLLSFNSSAEACGLRAIRMSSSDNPKSNRAQQDLKKRCYLEAGLKESSMNSNLYVWDLATKIKQDTFELLIKVMEQFEKSDCLGQIKKSQAASKVEGTKLSTGKKPKKKAAYQSPNLQDPRMISNSTEHVKIHATAPVMPTLSKLNLQFLHECCKHSEGAVVQVLSKVFQTHN